jgi:hypothetical protein
MKMTYLAALLCSVMAFGAVALVTAPEHTSGLYTEAQANAANTLATDTLQPATGLLAVANGAAAIDLTWTASTSAYAEGYNIYRSVGDNLSYAPLAFVAGGASTAYPDGGLAAATTYYYLVETVYQNWTSAFSNEASAATP